MDKINDSYIQLYEMFRDTKSFKKRVQIMELMNDIRKCFPSNELMKKIFFGMELTLTKGDVKRINGILFKRNLRSDLFMFLNKRFFYDYLPVSQLRATDYNFPQMDSKAFYLMIEDFLKKISPDLYDFYLGMLEDNTIFISRDICTNFLGLTGSLSVTNPDSYIMIRQCNTIADIRVVIHEIGHAYYNYLNNLTYGKLRTDQVMIKTEIPSNLLELLFINYLGKMGYNNEARQLHDIYISNMTNWLNNIHDYIMVKYAIGSYIAYRTCPLIEKGEYSIEELFKSFHETSYRDLLRLYKIDDTKGKMYCKK